MATTKSKQGDRLLPPLNGVAIRMYRQGLGDSFLLAFAGADPKRPTYVLIDCGVHMAQPMGREALRSILQNIIDVTAGHLDVVVATHEHTDHVSGFVHEADLLLDKRLQIDNLWLAWTEDENDAVAQDLRRGRAAAQDAIDAALEKLKRASSAGVDELSLKLEAAQSFFSVENGHEVPSWVSRLGLRDPNKVTGNELALAVLKHCSKPTFLRPGQISPVPAAASARAYVLGPPCDQRLLKKSKPSSGQKKETYLSDLTSMASFAAAAIDTNSHSEACQPFDQRFRHAYGWDCEQPFFASRYGFEETPHPLDWRKIESDWLFAAEELALHLDSHTNNTSLVLAFEIGPPGEGPILLFVADAQVGSWLSWQDLTWDSGGRRINMSDLFGRTAVYKVGHHASHNATLRRNANGNEYGLQLIPDGVLALVPVDQAAAEKLPGWEMPFPELYQALKSKARGNVLRSDDGRDSELPILRVGYNAVPGVDGCTWRRSKIEKPLGGPLYYDIRLSGRD